MITKKVIDNSFDVIAIEYLAIVQAIDYLQISEDLSGIQKQVYEQIRKIVPVFSSDTPKYKSIQQLKNLFILNYCKGFVLEKLLFHFHSVGLQKPDNTVNI